MKKTILIEGMSCGHCEGHVKKELENISGVDEAEVSASKKQAVVTLSSEVETSDFKAAVASAGYTFKSVK